MPFKVSRAFIAALVAMMIFHSSSSMVITLFKNYRCTYSDFIYLYSYMPFTIKILLTDWLASLSCSSFPRRRATPRHENHSIAASRNKNIVSLCEENEYSLAASNSKQKLSKLANTEYFMR